MNKLFLSLAALAALSGAAFAEPSRAFDQAPALKHGVGKSVSVTEPLAAAKSDGMWSNLDRTTAISGETGSNSHR